MEFKKNLGLISIVFLLLHTCLFASEDSNAKELSRLWSIRNSAFQTPRLYKTPSPKPADQFDFTPSSPQKVFPSIERSFAPVQCPLSSSGDFTVKFAPIRSSPSVPQLTPLENLQINYGALHKKLQGTVCGESFFANGATVTRLPQEPTETQRKKGIALSLIEDLGQLSVKEATNFLKRTSEDDYKDEPDLNSLMGSLALVDPETSEKQHFNEAFKAGVAVWTLYSYTFE